jgi:predicted CXXCH cytochrome family protein
MKSTTAVGWMIGGAAACAVALAVTLSPGELRAAEEKKVPTGDLEVTVDLEGIKAKTSTLFVKDQSMVLNGKENKHLFAMVPSGNIAATVDVTVSGGWFRDDQRYVGVAVVFVGEGKRAEVTIKPRLVLPETGKSIEELCAECHPHPKGEIKAGQIPRDVHKSGVPMSDRKKKVTVSFNATVEKLRKEGKGNFRPIKLEERIIEEKGKKIKKTFLTCESCHTPHHTTPYRWYLVAPYKTMKDELCLGCHD